MVYLSSDLIFDVFLELGIIQEGDLCLEICFIIFSTCIWIIKHKNVVVMLRGHDDWSTRSGICGLGTEFIKNV